MACLLKNEPTSPSIQLFKSLWDESKAKASVNSAFIAICSGPEAKRACHDQGEFFRKEEGGPNP